MEAEFPRQVLQVKVEAVVRALNLEGKLVSASYKAAMAAHLVQELVGRSLPVPHSR